MSLSHSNKETFFFILISIYSFIVCFGNFFRLGTNESAIGLSTIIIAIALFSFPIRAINGVLSSQILKSFLVLLFISLFSAFFYPDGISMPLKGSIQLFGYLFVAGVASSMNLDHKALKRIFNGIVYGLLISGLITIIDYLKIYDFPYVNENKILSKYGGIQAEQAGGFFNRRSAMAAYLSLFIPMVVIVAVELSRGLMKVITLSAAGISFISLFLTHNRSGILGILIALALFLFFNKGYTVQKKVKVGFSMITLMVLIAIVIYLYFPEHITIYMEKLGIANKGDSSNADIALSQSDGSRVYFFIEAMKGILSSPIGNGFATMYTSRYGYMDTHNIISYIIWATGVFGLLWVGLLFFQLKKVFKSNFDDFRLHIYFNGLKYGMISWILNNMTHNNINMAITWVFIGFLISLSNQS